MGQFLRPSGNVTRSNITGSYTDVWEETADDTDYVYGAAGTVSVFEVDLSDPADTPGGGATTVRYRIAKGKSGSSPFVLASDGETVTVTCALYQSTTLIDTDAARTATGAWTEYNFNPDTSTVSDWNDLHLRFTTAHGGGTARMGGISWAEAEVPEGATSVTATLSQTLAPLTLTAFSGAASAGSLSVTLGTLVLVSRAGGPHTSATLSVTLGELILAATVGDLFYKHDQPAAVVLDEAAAPASASFTKHSQPAAVALE